MRTVVVSGALANRPGNGGGAWVRLNWLLGLRRLGLDVHFLEQIGAPACVDAAGQPAAFSASVNLAFFRDVTRQFGFEGRASLVYEGGEQVFGPDKRTLLDLAGSADLLINLSGHLTLAPLLRRFRRRAYVDLDPGYTQIWHAEGGGARLAGHDVYFTVGSNVGRPGCPVPTGGLRWHPIRPPVVLDEWPVVEAAPAGRFTTVASWRGAFGPPQLGGRTLGVKAHEFRKFVSLPARAGQKFEVALSIHPADEKDLCNLRTHGWRVVSPAAVAHPDTYRAYVQGSGAEFSPAQGVYVETGSGWFSDRTAAYLASGRPALVQDTGFGRDVPTGEGLLTFRDLEGAVSGAASIARDYARHSEAARALARNHFDSARVLGGFLDAACSFPNGGPD